MPIGFYWLMAAQFLSALADNALLIVTIALLAQLQAADWMTPLLKLFFTISYVVLAPLAGVYADRLPKKWAMFCTNLLKATAPLGMLWFDLDPIAAFALVGIGATGYSPAKYGLVTELVPADKLVRANGWIETLTVGAIVLGTFVGGALIHPQWIAAVGGLLGRAAPAGSLDAIDTALLAVLSLYLAAALVNLAIPRLALQYPRGSLQLGALLRDFWRCNLRLWRDPRGQISLATTSLFWGAGATLQFVVLAWAQSSLGLTLSAAAMLQGVVAVGIAIGAVWAATTVPLASALRILPVGVAMGLTVIPTLWIDASLGAGLTLAGVPLHVLLGGALMALVGGLGGYFVVPMNAVLQHRGHQLLTAGRSIAVQNFNENGCVLLMLSAYALTIQLGLPVTRTILLFGLFIAFSMTLVWRWHGANLRRAAGGAQAA